MRMILMLSHFIHEAFRSFDEFYTKRGDNNHSFETCDFQGEGKSKICEI